MKVYCVSAEGGEGCLKSSDETDFKDVCPGFKKVSLNNLMLRYKKGLNKIYKGIFLKILWIFLQIG